MLYTNFLIFILSIIIIYLLLEQHKNPHLIEKFDTKIDSTYNNLFSDINNNMFSINLKGIIVAWYGDINKKPADWAICDGKNGTPDLSSRFILAAGQSKELTKRTFGTQGGEETHRLTATEIPAHTHKYWRESTHCNQNCPSGSGMNSMMADYAATQPTEPAGGDFPHENMPPFYALYYIQKI